MRFKGLSPCLVSFCLCVSFLAAQELPHGENPAGEFHGIVVAAGTSRPLPGVMITLRDNSGKLAGAQPSIVTGDDGSFHFTGLSKGFHTFYCYKPGYRTSQSPTYQAYLGPDEAASGLVIELPPPGAITGVIRGPDGRPLADVKVAAERTYEIFQDVDFREWQSAISDDEGRYRITGLPVGRYYVRAVASDPAEQPVYAPTYYPGTLDLTAAGRARIDWGGEASGIDIRLKAAPHTTVRGRLVNGLNGKPCASCDVTVVQVEGRYARRVERLASTRTAADGRFEIRGLVPGGYILLARQDEPDVYARAEIQVTSERATGVAMTLLAGANVSGTTRIAANVPDSIARAGAANPLVRLYSPDAWAPQRNAEAAPDQDGNFSLAGVPPGRYKIETNCGVEDAYLISASVSGRELPAPYLNVHAGAAVEDLDLVCGLGKAQIHPTIKPSAQTEPFHRLPGVWIWYRPTTESSEYLFPGMFGISGSGRLTGVNLKFRPGRYTIYAVSDLLELEWADPEVQRVLAPYGVEVELKRDETTEVELVFVPSGIRLP